MRNGLRLDVTVERRSAAANRPRRATVVLHDPSGLVGASDAVTPRYQPTPAWLAKSVEDFLRFLDQLSVVVVRREWIAGMDNAWYLISQLVDLYGHHNRAVRTSPRRVNERLTSAQREAIESLPPIRADEQAVIAVHMAIAALYLPAAKGLSKELGVAWPEELERTVLEHLEQRTGARLSP
jgi:hypothetical protein